MSWYFSFFYVFFCAFYLSSQAYSDEKTLRIVSLAPSHTELVYALNLGNSLVGNTTHCNYPKEAIKVQKIGDFSQPNLESILALRPSIVLASRGNPLTTLTQLKKLGIQVLESDAATADALSDSIRSIAKALNKEPEGRAIAMNIENRLLQLDALGKRRKAERLSKALIVLSWEPVYSATPTTWLGDLFTRAGFINIIKNTQNAYPQISKEIILKEKPDYFFADAMSFSAITQTGRQLEFSHHVQKLIGQDTPKAKKIILPQDVLMRPGPRIVDGIQFLMETP